MSGLQNGDGGTQFVGNVGDEVAAQLVLVVPSVRHLVECPGEFADLAEAADVAGADSCIAEAPGPGDLYEPV